MSRDTVLTGVGRADPQRHPSEARLLDYACGSLAGSARLVVGAHLLTCPACSRAVGEFERVGGDWLEALDPALMSPEALPLALARIDRPSPPAAPAAPRPEGWLPVPDAVARASLGRRRRAAGAWIVPVSRGPGAERCYLLGMSAGRGAPAHGHRAGEMTVVLRGAFCDGDEVYGPGDFCEHDGSIKHAPRATATGDCVCLIHTDGPLAAVDWVGRLVFPLLGVG